MKSSREYTDKTHKYLIFFSVYRIFQKAILGQIVQVSSKGVIKRYFVNIQQWSKLIEVLLVWVRFMKYNSINYKV